MKNVTGGLALERLELFYDAVPRRVARVEEHGPLRLFVRDRPGHPFYARPSGAGEPAVRDVAAVRARQRELGVPEAFEWVHELAPALTAAARDDGLDVRLCPLLVLDPAAVRDLAAFAAAAVPDGATIRFLDPDDDRFDTDLALARAVAHVAFTETGTAIGAAGTAERDAATTAVPAAELAEARDAARSGDVLVAVVVAAAAAGAAGETGAVAVGSAQVAGGVAEVTGVGTLPAWRRRGFGAALTAALTRRVLADGADTAFLSAEGDDVARVYAHAGFRRVATAGIAQA